MSAKKPEPLHAGRKREPCPVCGEISYSLGGVHPQCAVRQADEKRMQKIKRHQLSSKTPKAPTAVKPWQRICHKCKAVLHIRKKICDCGHQNVIVPASERGLES